MRARTVVALGVAAMTTACNHAQSPTSPTAPVPPDRDAAVAVHEVSALRELSEANTDVYRVDLVLRELAGAAATIKAVDVSFDNGLAGTFGPEAASSPRIPAGGVVHVQGLQFTGDANQRASGVQIRVLSTDDRGRDAVSLAASSITPAYTLSGRVSDAVTGRAIGGATVTLTFGRATGVSDRTDTTGTYRLRTIPRGPVAFTVAASGFTTVTKTVDLSANTVVNVALTRED